MEHYLNYNIGGQIKSYKYLSVYCEVINHSRPTWSTSKGSTYQFEDFKAGSNCHDIDVTNKQYSGIKVKPINL